MKYSKLFGKTNKDAKEMSSRNATLLQKAGFINQLMAGVYTFLPLGLRVLNKIEQITREEMDKIGSELLMPSLSPKKIWEQTGRIDSVDVLFKIEGANKSSKERNSAEYILNFTHEDVLTSTLKKLGITSYKDFPYAVYQIQTKFRNEPRPKTGIMRGREFRMKDLYSFHTSSEDFNRYYHEEAIPAYKRIYDRIGMGKETVVTLASGGDFTDDYSHEFQTFCEAGEDLIFYSKKTDTWYNKEVTPSKAPDFFWATETKDMSAVYGEGITGMDELVKFLGLPPRQCMKTMIYVTDTNEIVAVGVQGTYEVNEIKLKKVLGVKKVSLADEATIKKVTGAEVGYAGIVGLPAGVKVIIDESMENAVNFECGGNKTHYHNINVNWDRDVKKPEKFYDVKVAQEGDLDPEDGSVYKVRKASEVGNVFPLGAKYTNAFEYTYNDKDGSAKEIYMGSYGIGTSRIMGVIAENYNDENGLLWPKSIAPFHVQLISIGNEGIVKAEELHKVLEDEGIEVLWDDREDIRPGEKFKDSDLIGNPVRIVVSDKTLKSDQVEIKRRASDDIEMVNIRDISARVKELVG